MTTSPTKQRPLSHSNLTKMSTFLLQCATDNADLLQESEDDSWTITMDTVLDKESGVPCMWECGGSDGLSGMCLSILNDKMHTQRPLKIIRGRVSFNGQHALIRVWPGCHVLAGVFHPKQPYVVGLFRITELKYDHERRQDCAVLKPIHVSSYINYESMHSLLVNTHAGIQQGDEYFRTTEDWAHPVTMIYPKLSDYLARYPIHTRPWLASHLQEKDKPLLTDFEFNEAKPLKNLTEFYNTIRSKARWLADVHHTSMGMIYEISVDSPNVVSINVELVKRGARNKTPFIQFSMNVQCAFTIHLDMTKLKTFWLPDHDPWYTKDIELLKQMITDAELGTETTKRQFYIFVG